MGQFFLTVITLGVMIFALVDIITSDEWRIKHLPKVAWAIIVILLPMIGSILWFVLGKERSSSAPAAGSFGDPRRAPVAAPHDDLDLESAVEREIEFHEKQAEIRRLEEQLRAKREGKAE